MTPETLIAGIESLIATYRWELPLVVPAGGDLQSALNTGHPNIFLEGGTYGAAVINHPVTLTGNGSALHNPTGPALHVVPGTKGVIASDLSCTSGWRGAVVQLGDNVATTQSTLDQVPTHIKLQRVIVPTHRGKRGFEINAAAELLDCNAFDIYDPALADSQAIAVLNTPGPVTVLGGTFEAGSENILIGGDTLKIPGIIQTDLTFDGVTLRKPLSWRTDGINRAVKNLFEVKAGRRVTLKNSSLSGSWKASQDGWAIVITPKNNNFIEGVLIDNVTVTDAGSGIQFLGRDYNSVTPQPTTGVVVRDSRFTVSKAFGGRGTLALYVEAMQDSLWERVTASFDGPAIVQCDSKTPTGPFTMRECVMPTGAYAVQAPGVNYGGSTGYVGREFVTVFENNTFSGAPSAFKKFYPANTWV